MKKELFIGLMSATSADAMDAALVDFTQIPPQLIANSSIPIPEKTQTLIHQLAISGDHEIQKIRDLDKSIAQLSCQAIDTACNSSQYKKQDIIAVGSHGQTIRHYAKTKERSGYSLQVGDPNIIAETTGITTIADFRRRDIAAGGHGAPLAPGFHRGVFHSKTQHRIIVNLGGIANISLLHPDGNVIGYDTGPANGLMDSWCQKHYGRRYDNNGEWAKTGTPNQELLNQLLDHPFLSQPHPKSTGREDFNIDWLEKEIASHNINLPNKDIQATLLQFTVESLSKAIECHEEYDEAEIYLCGGGAKNTFLLQSLSARLSPRTVNTTQALGVDPDWVEAIAFAWFAKQTLEHVSSNIGSVTGAKREVILGGIYLGKPK